MGGINHISQTHVVPRPYADQKSVATGPVNCVSCDRIIPAKDWSAHERSKKHLQNKAQKEEDAKAKTKADADAETSDERTSTWVDGQAATGSWADEATENAGVKEEASGDWQAQPVDGGDNNGFGGGDAWGGNDAGGNDGFSSAPRRGGYGGGGGYEGNGGNGGGGGDGCFKCGQRECSPFSSRIDNMLTSSQLVIARLTAH